jgi:tetratricopeptide (TPR) repeat protein
MDLLDFTVDELYFDKPLPAEVSKMIDDASDLYGTEEAEHKLLSAYFLEPENFTVLVALYRYYYYQHRYRDSMLVAERTLIITADMLGITRDWRTFSAVDLAYGVQHSMALMRFYLYALKGAGYLSLRMNDFEGARERFQKIVDIDTSERIGATPLLELALEAIEEQNKASVATA